MIEAFKLLEGIENVDYNQFFKSATTCPERTRQNAGLNEVQTECQKVLFQPASGQHPE